MPKAELTTRLRRITDGFATAPQLMIADMQAAKQAGFALILNARPDGEEDEDEQPPSLHLKEAAQTAGLAYAYVPILNGAAFSHNALIAAGEAMADNGGPVLGFCLTGMRSLRLWALASALYGREEPDRLILAAAVAGLSLDAFAEHLQRLSRGQAPLYVADEAAMMI
ncbi:MAG: TIGR01244 family phosphatase [Robiginitomaculum sp.]|nr:MAG: TIGR01244 family phosphatase [Robiginitomaculum sp.]